MTMAAARVIGLFGPTGSGKTEIAVELAAQLGTVVVNADPQQCYQGMPILTNQPEAAHDAIAPHDLIAIWPMTHVASIADFAAIARPLIDQIATDRGSVVVCGGSGLYLRAALTDMSLAPQRANLGDDDEHTDAERTYDNDGPAAAHAALVDLDPDAAERIHPNDRKRLVRALDLARAGSSINAGAGLWDEPYRQPTAVFRLILDRQLLHQRIERRADEMFEAGVVDEVAAIVGDTAQHHDDALSMTAARIHGVDHICSLLRGEIDNATARQRIVVATRQYAKRQDTWGRRWPDTIDLTVDPTSTSAAEIASLGLTKAGLHALQ